MWEHSEATAEVDQASGWENGGLEPSCSADGNLKGAVLAEDSLAASPKVNRLPTGASRVTPRCMPQRMEPRDANQPLYGNLHSNAAHGSQTVNTTQMSANG